MKLFYKLIDSKSHRNFILLHGILGNSRNLNGLSQSLKDIANIYSVDLRNHGNSPKVSSNKLLDHANDIKLLIEEKGLSNVTVIGHSFGGKVGTQLATSYPEVLERLVLLDVSPYPMTVEQYQRNQVFEYITKLSALDLTLGYQEVKK